MLSEFSEDNLRQLVQAASNLSYDIYYSYEIDPAEAKRYVSDIEPWKNWFIGESETSSILAAYNKWKTDFLARNVKAPSWAVIWKAFHSDVFRVYDIRLAKLYDISKRAHLIPEFISMEDSVGKFATLYASYIAYSPSAAKPTSEIEKALKEAWDKMSPVLKWGALGVAALLALSGFMKEKK